MARKTAASPAPEAGEQKKPADNALTLSSPGEKTPGKREPRSVPIGMSGRLVRIDN